MRDFSSKWLLLVLCASTWLFVSCGRMEQAGIAAPPGAKPSPDVKTQIREKLDQQTAKEQAVSSQLDELAGRIAAAQTDQAGLQTQMRTEVAEKARQYSAQDYQYRIEEQNRKEAEAQLGTRIQQTQQQLDELNSAYQWQSNEGYYNPGRIVSSDDVNQKARELGALQAQYQALRQQGAQAEADQQARSRWEEGAEQSALQQEYQQKYADASAAMQNLNSQYQKLQQQDSQLRQSMSDLEDQLEVTG